MKDIWLRVVQGCGGEKDGGVQRDGLEGTDPASGTDKGVVVVTTGVGITDWVIKPLL